MCWWPRAESNHRHADFQSAALPTELLGREPAIIAAPNEPSSRLHPPALVARQVHPELLQLPIQVRPLQPRLLRHPRHRAVLLRQVKLEVALLERIPRLAQ